MKTNRVNSVIFEGQVVSMMKGLPDLAVLMLRQSHAVCTRPHAPQRDVGINVFFENKLCERVLAQFADQTKDEQTSVWLRVQGFLVLSDDCPCIVAQSYQTISQPAAEAAEAANAQG